jgi:hypothetical protein
LLSIRCCQFYLSNHTKRLLGDISCCDRKIMREEPLLFRSFPNSAHSPIHYIPNSGLSPIEHTSISLKQRSFERVLIWIFQRCGIVQTHFEIGWSSSIDSHVRYLVLNSSTYKLFVVCNPVHSGRA